MRRLRQPTAVLVEIQPRARLVAQQRPIKALDSVAQLLARPIRRRHLEAQPLLRPIKTQVLADPLLVVLLLDRPIRLRPLVPLQLRDRATVLALVARFSAHPHLEATVRVFSRAEYALEFV